MEVLKKVTNFVSKYMAVIVIAMAALALLAPNTVSFIKTSYVNTLLGIVMFGMGLTLKPGDFKVVFSRPKDVVIGCIAQFTVMPLLAFALQSSFICRMSWQSVSFLSVPVRVVLLPML